MNSLTTRTTTNTMTMRKPWTSKVVRHTSPYSWFPISLYLGSFPAQIAGSASSEEDIELDDVDDDDIKVGSEGKKAYEVDYKPLTHQQVKDLMVVDVDYISTIFG